MTIKIREPEILYNFIKYLIKERLSDQDSESKERIKEIVSVIKEYFGEERVDVTSTIIQFSNSPDMKVPDEDINNLSKEDYFKKNGYIRFPDNTNVLMYLTNDYFGNIIEWINSYSDDSGSELKEFLYKLMKKGPCYGHEGHFKEGDRVEDMIFETVWNDYSTRKDKIELLSYIKTYIEERVLYKALNDNTEITIWFPMEKVTNEIGNSTIIHNAFVRITLDEKGNISNGPSMMRTSFTKNELKAKYIHSHVPTHHFDKLNINNYTFNNMCTGRGPINNDLYELRKLSYNCTNNKEFIPLICGSFCYNLEKIVRIESIKGGPYIQLYKINEHGTIPYINEKCSINPHLTSKDKEFTKYYLSNNHLKFVFANDSWCLGMTFSEFFIDLTTSYRKYCEKNMLKPNFNKITIKDGKLYKYNSIGNHMIDYTLNDAYECIGYPMLKFKEKTFKFEILDNDDGEEETFDCINTTMGMNVLYAILYYLNNKTIKLTDNGK